MTIYINGSTGISGVDGSAGTPALQGSDSNTGISFGSDVILASTGGTERFRVDSSGRLLVGTSSVSGSGGAAPFAKIQVEGNTYGANGPGSIAIRTDKATTSIVAGNEIGQIAFAASGSNGDFARIECIADATAGTNDYPGRLVFSTTADGASSPTERMRITSDGRLLCGYTSSSNTNAGVVNAVGFAHKQGTGGAPGSSAFNFYWTGSLQAWIDTSNVGNVTLTSDYRIKKNIETQANPAIPRLKQLRPVTYERANYGTLFTEDGVAREGFIAHELAEIIPSAVEGEKDAENQIQSINIDALVSVLTKALQEAVEKIETLEAKVAALEAS